MSSYKENLNSTTAALLQAREMDQNNLSARLNASMFAIYYAKDTKISAAEKLKLSHKKYVFAERLKEQAVVSNNAATNVLVAAGQQRASTAQSVSGTAVCAANIQVAANAIIRLAGDIGTVFSIVNAADFSSDIYLQSKKTQELINETAEEAEKVSQLAMEASIHTAAVSSSAVADQAKTTNDSVNAIFKVISGHFDTAAAVVASDNTALSAAEEAEKKFSAEGQLINGAYTAAKTAYEINNKELNLDLKVQDPGSDFYTVSFDCFKSPFSAEEAEQKNEKPVESPVNNYYIMLVKNSKKSTFSASNAEGLITQTGSKQYIIPKLRPDTDGKVIKKISVADLMDSDGEQMALGQQYVIFVLTEFTEVYKKFINNFNNYLSAPSFPFTITHQLVSPKPGKSNIAVNNNMLTFHLKENRFYDVEYRCMFLPVADAEAQPGFVFNCMLAEQVSAGNYQAAVLARNASAERTGDDMELIQGSVKITDAVLDNFGNPLINGEYYVPAILSFATEKQDQFTNSLSGYTVTTSFRYVEGKISTKR